MVTADRALYEAKANGRNEVRTGGAGTQHARVHSEMSAAARPELPYILVADPSDARAGVYRERADRSRLGLLVARDGGQALRVMQQFGPPILLVVDLGSRALNGVALLEWLHAKAARTSVVALSSAAATLKRYVATTSAASHTTVLRPDAPPSLLRSALATALAASDGAELTITPARSESLECPVKVRRVVPALAGTREWQPTLLERQRGEFEVARELARSRREPRQLSIGLFDLSGRSDAGQTEPGAAIIASIGDALIREIRPSDLPIQWSGNELLLVLPGLKGDDARVVAERVRAAMQAASLHRVAVAGGVAELQQDEQIGSAVKRARDRVVLALSQGHNRVS